MSLSRFIPDFWTMALCSLRALPTSTVVKLQRFFHVFPINYSWDTILIYGSINWPSGKPHSTLGRSKPCNSQVPQDTAEVVWELKNFLGNSFSRYQLNNLFSLAIFFYQLFHDHLCMLNLLFHYRRSNLDFMACRKLKILERVRYGAVTTRSFMGDEEYSDVERQRSWSRSHVVSCNFSVTYGSSLSRSSDWFNLQRKLWAHQPTIGIAAKSGKTNQSNQWIVWIFLDIPICGQYHPISPTLAICEHHHDSCPECCAEFGKLTSEFWCLDPHVHDKLGCPAKSVVKYGVPHGDAAQGGIHLQLFSTGSLGGKMKRHMPDWFQPWLLERTIELDVSGDVSRDVSRCQKCFVFYFWMSECDETVTYSYHTV